MFRIYCFIILLIFVNSCAVKKKIGSSKKEYILSYKKAVLYGCINSATNQNFIDFSKRNNDLGLSIETAVLFHSEVLKAQSIGAELSERIRTINYSDYNGRKPIFSDCVSFSFNKSIDSLAKAKFKELRKAELVYENK